MKAWLASKARYAAREFTAMMLRYSGIPLLVRYMVSRRRVTIVMYHDPAPETLDRHLEYLARHYRFTTLDCLVNALLSGDWSSIAPRSLVVTIDDGMRGNLLLGEVFQKYGCRPTIYICTKIVGTRRRFWFTMGDVRYLKPLPHEERLKKLFELSGFEPTREYEECQPQALSEDDVRSMMTWADIGAHSRLHPILTTCSDQICEDEIRGSREDVVELCGACPHFSYPNGDYTAREIALVKAAGYRSARTTDFGWNGPGADPYRLRVAGATDDASINVLAVQLACISSYFRLLLRGRFTGSTIKNLPDVNRAD